MTEKAYRLTKLVGHDIWRIEVWRPEGWFHAAGWVPHKIHVLRASRDAEFTLQSDAEYVLRSLIRREREGIARRNGLWSMVPLLFLQEQPT